MLATCVHEADGATGVSMKLLIAYDGSDCADAALADLRRAGLPAAVDATVLTVADVWLPPSDVRGTPPLPGWMAVAGKESEARAAKAVSEAQEMAVGAATRLQADFPRWSVRGEASADSPAWGIVKKSESWGADLVLVGSHGRSATSRLGLGSVSQKVAAEAPCSVRIARGHAGENGSPARIVVAVDGSPDSEEAIRRAAERDWPAGTAIRLLTIVDSRLATALSLDEHPAHQWVREGDEDEGAWVRRMSGALSESLGARGLAVSHLTKFGDPKQMLVEEADRWGADSIFIGARSLTKAERSSLGGVAAAVASRARCSVEVVRPARKVPAA